MNDETSVPVHWSFWAISVIALIWNLLGIMNYLAQTNAEVVAAMPETHRAIIETRPAWATGGFAIGVFGGALGCLLLLLRRSAAYYLMIASLVGVVLTMIHSFSVIGTVEFSTFESIMMLAMPLIGAFFLIWYVRLSEQRGWLR